MVIFLGDGAFMALGITHMIIIVIILYNFIIFLYHGWLL